MPSPIALTPAADPAVRVDALLLTAQVLFAALTAVCVVSSLIAVNVAIGRRQRREGHGTWGRLLGVAAAVAGLQLAPAIAGLLLWWCDFRWVDEQSLLAAAMLLTLPNVLILLSAMGPTVRFLHSKDPLPLLADASLLDRVAELAEAMKLPVPVVRMLPTAGGELQAQAFAGGLVAPSLVVGDGILHRLSPDERDATIGHELAHIANGSLWWLTAAVPTAITAGVVVGSFASIGIALAFAFTFWMGLRNIVSRHFEYDCDRRAADVLGFRTTFSALSKIHAANPLRDAGWLSFVIFATATHPSRAQRLSAIRNAAPPDERQTMIVTAADVSKRRVAGFAAITCWVAALAGLTLWSRQQSAPYLQTLLMMLVGVVPWLAIIAETRRATRDTRRRMVERKRGVRLVLALMVAFIAVWFLLGDRFGFGVGELTEYDGSIASPLIFTTLFLFLVILLLLSLRNWATRDLHVQQQVAIAMQTRDFDKVFELADMHSKAFERAATLRHNLGFAAAMTGQQEWAIRILEALRHDEPGFSESIIVLAMLHLDDGRPDAALPFIEEVQRKLPNDPTPVMLCGLTLRYLGRFEEAQACVDRALALKPDSGNVRALAAWIALDRGDLKRAEQFLVTAEEHDPGTAFIEYVKAHVALAGNDPAAARQQVERAMAASDANPYSLLQKRVRRLADRVAPG